MAQRPALKLKLTTAPPPSSPSPTPTSGATKIKLKIKSMAKTSGAPSMDSLSPSKPKAIRKPKKEKSTRISTPTAKKRDLAISTLSDEDDYEDTPSASKSGILPRVKRIKLNTRAPSTPFIRLKGRGRPPMRPFGVGYDSEASDREEDPAIEEEFILRMAPGPDCDYLRQAVTERRFGPKSEGGADVRMRFLQSDGRRAVVTIQGRHYAASMVDLPCIVEAMKSWDRRGWYKTADICQMLLVLGRIEREEEANTYPLPTRDLDEKTWQYAHGLTPPMRWVRRRRFRKRISNRTIEAVEDEVERLCREDDECEASRYEVIDPDRMTREQSARASSEGQDGYNMLGNAGMQGGLEDGEQDAEGDLDDSASYFDTTNADVNDDDGLEADLERAMEMDLANNEETGSAPPLLPAPLDPIPDLSTAAAVITTTTTTTITSLSSVVAPTAPAADTPSKDGSGDESESSGEDADVDDEDEEVDEDVLEQQRDLQRQREGIADLEAAIKGQEAELERLQNPILRQKLLRKIQSLRADLDLKKVAIGEGVDD